MGGVDAAGQSGLGKRLDNMVGGTDYSTSGSVGTWKLGATYSPIRDIKFRGA